jgi:hypothetical protein
LGWRGRVGHFAEISRLGGDCQLQLPPDSIIKTAVPITFNGFQGFRQAVGPNLNEFYFLV